MQHQPTTATTPSPLWTAVRWISIVIAVGIVVMAVLIGQGVWGGERGLINGHGHWGIGVFTLSAIQFVLAIALYQKKQIPVAHMVITFVLVLLLISQIGIGYSGRSNTDLIAWHVPLGVLLMSLATFNAALAWLRPVAATTRAGERIG